MAAALVIVTAGSSAVVPAFQGAGSGIDVCALLPREEAGKILGATVRARPVTRADGAAECRYAGAMPGTVTVMVGAGTPKPAWDTFMKELKESGASLEPAPGVGDGAFFWDAHRLYAHTATYQIAVSTNPAPGEDLAKVRANAIALANAIVAKLKNSRPASRPQVEECSR
jgi:hypothetical protein